jgi:2-dehydro-3-deoxygluconokinase
VSTTAQDIRSQIDVAAIGETMIVFTGRPGSDDWNASSGGAESNVAAALSALGHTTRWVSRLGDDRLGRLVADEIRDRGVHVDVEWDAERPTGLMTKYVVDGRTERRYYRSESAARELSPSDLDRLAGARFVHVTGITAALSASARSMVTEIVDGRLGPEVTVSFDVNLRPALWPDATTMTQVLVPLARSADLVFIGDDEARQLLGTDDLDRVAALLNDADDHELVLKRGPGPASVAVRDRATTVPALGVDVVDPTGAGDAFTAGFLAGRLRGADDAACLRLGHVLASRVMTTTRDVATPPDPDEVAAALAG